MHIEQLSWHSAGGWRTERGALDGDADLVLAFGARALLDAARHAELAARYPRARLLGCTTAGEVCGDAVGYGSLGGWDSFGPDRVVTRAEGNVLYELDGQPALDLYKRYLGEFADGLPASGLLFPLALQTPGQGGNGLVRTMLAVDETQGSMSFAGDIPTGAHVRLMKANFERLVEGAEGAARSSHERLGEAPAELAVLISCVGRKLVLQQRIDEEIEGVRDVLGPQSVFCGFYSYGEISPFTPTARCELHNQTMTITTLAER
jgi:hypothetical protein